MESNVRYFLVCVVIAIILLINMPGADQEPVSAEQNATNETLPAFAIVDLEGNLIEDQSLANSTIQNETGE